MNLYRKQKDGHGINCKGPGDLRHVREGDAELDSSAQQVAKRAGRGLAQTQSNKRQRPGQLRPQIAGHVTGRGLPPWRGAVPTHGPLVGQSKARQ